MEQRGSRYVGGLERLAPKIECLLHRAVRKAEQYGLLVGLERVWQPRRADEYVPGSKDQRLASQTTAALAFDDCIYRGVGRAIVLPLNPCGRSCMKVPMVGIAQSPVTGFVYCSLWPQQRWAS